MKNKETDIIIVCQLMKLTGGRRIKVICDDTDVFVLLVHFYDKLYLSCNIIMESLVANRNITNIEATS